MANPLVRVTAYYVGQGLAQLVEVFDSGSPLSEGCQYLALVDFGSEKVRGNYASLEAKPGALGQSCTEIKQKIVDHGTKLELLVISHTDFDHISILKELLADLNQSGPPFLAVRKVIIGGTPYERNSLESFSGNTIKKKKPSATLSALGKLLSDLKKANLQMSVAFFGGKNHYYDKSGTGYTAKDDWLDHLNYGPVGLKNPKVLLRILTSRHFINDKNLQKDAAAYINTNSAVVVVEAYADDGDSTPASAILLTGDIQWDTIKYLDDTFAAAADCFPFLAVPKAMVVPHHGALKTACKGDKVTPKVALTTQLADLHSWAGKLSCGVLIVSAKDGIFPHPCAQVLDQLGGSEMTAAAHQNFVKEAPNTPATASPNYTSRTLTGITRARYTTFAGKTGTDFTGRDVTITIETDGSLSTAVNDKTGA